MKLTKTFKEFTKDYFELYQEKNFVIRYESEFQEVCFDIYETEDFEIDYENEIINLYNVPKIISFEQFRRDNKGPCYTDTHNIETIIDDLYENNSFEIDEVNQRILLY